MRIAPYVVLLSTLVACDNAGDKSGVEDTTDPDTDIVDSEASLTDSLDPGDSDGPCPMTCDDADPCTEDSVVSGSAATCDLVCAHRDVSSDPDLPDDAFFDSNCDGFDGTVDGLVFVAPDGADTAGCGTPDEPCATLANGSAIAYALGADLAVSAGSYPETLRVVAGVSVYGGYDRAAGWLRSDAVYPSLEPSAIVDSGAGPKLIAGVSAFGITEPTVLDRLLIRPASAPADVAGVSVVGVWLVRAPGVSMNALTIEPGDGSPGVAGATGAQGLPGNSAVPAPWTASTQRAGLAGAPGTVCALGPNTAGGGAGGSGGQDDLPAACGTGTGNPPRAGGAGSCPVGSPGGAGRSANNCTIPDVSSTTGGDATSCLSLPSVPALGAPMAVDLGGVRSDYWAVGDGATGGAESVGPGGHGGHGGGGGGQGDAVFCDRGGAGGGGGGGGAGGCGGLPGGGAGGGGASIGVLLVGSEGVEFAASSAWAGAGGVGGVGGAGGMGGQGGAGASGAFGGFTFRTCDPLGENQDGRTGGTGGAGGAGGRGGGGGGGAGGASLGLVLCESSVVGDLVAVAGEPGEGGAGGVVAGPRGSDGVALDVLDGCSLDASSVEVEVGFTRSGAYELWSPSQAGYLAQSVSSPNLCSAGFELVGGVDGDGGFWLCATLDRAENRFIVANGDGTTNRLWSVQAGNAADRGDAEFWGQCLDRPRVWDGGEANSEHVSTWVCMEPLRRVTRFAATDLLEWPPRNTTVTVSPGDASLVLTSTGGDPWLESPRGLDLDASRTQIRVTMSNETTSTDFQVFFHRVDQGGFTAAQVFTGALPSTVTPVTVLLDASSHPEWYGTIDALRFDWTGSEAGSATVVALEVSR
jgi:hypothetical protein